MIVAEAIAALQSRVFAGQWERVILPDEKDGVIVTRRLDDRCRVTLPSDICEFLDLHPGDFTEILVKKVTRKEEKREKTG